jgi:hypothetical protein
MMIVRRIRDMRKPARAVGVSPSDDFAFRERFTKGWQYDSQFASMRKPVGRVGRRTSDAGRGKPGKPGILFTYECAPIHPSTYGRMALFLR